MIQFKRGKSSSWSKQKQPLADGQPGYDKDRKKIKIGNGKDSWDDLPDASGMFADEILDSEKNAKIKVAAKLALNPLGGLVNKILKKEDRPIFTYGEEAPDKDTVGQVYLQYYDTEPEVDYVVSSGINNGWMYQKWRSGRATCQGTFSLETQISEELPSGLYKSTHSLKSIKYPFEFIIDDKAPAPAELITLQSPGWIAWPVGTRNDSSSRKKTSATYNIVSTDKQANEATYLFSIQVAGYWR